MAGGFWAADSIATGIEADIAARQHAQEQQSLQGRLNQLSKRYDTLALANAANLAEKHALRVALAKFDPKHPLVVDPMQQKRVQDLGERAFSINNNYDDAARAGRNFRS